MNLKILTKSNTNILHQVIGENDVFICVQDDSDSCAIITPIDTINADILEKNA